MSKPQETKNADPMAPEVDTSTGRNFDVDSEFDDKSEEDAYQKTHSKEGPEDAANREGGGRQYEKKENTQRVRCGNE